MLLGIYTVPLTLVAVDDKIVQNKASIFNASMQITYPQRKNQAGNLQK